MLEDANVKLASVATNTLGKNGRAMLEEIVAGQDDPEYLASLAALGHLRAKTPQLVQLAARFELILRLAHRGDQLSIIEDLPSDSRLHQRTSLLPDSVRAHSSELWLPGPDPVGDPLLGFSRFIQVVVLVVLRTLQRQLKCEAILGDLVDPYSRGNFSRSRVSSALLARFGGSVRLP